MRYMRLLAALLLLSALLGALTGCGGGGGNTRSAPRKITITLRWPSAGRNSNRVIPQAGTNAVLVEIYDGVTRLQPTVTFVNGVTTQSVTVPGKALTFYANAFSDPATPLNNYVTDPTTGALGKGTPGSITPLTASDAHPIAHAVTIADVTTTPNVTFTLDNTIATFKPITTPTDTTTFALETTPIALNNTVQALTADGAVVVVGASALSWAISSADTLENARASVNAGNQLVLRASGVVHVTVTDNEVTPDPVHNGNPISATFAYTIKPRTVQPQLTLNTGLGSPLLTSLPDYVRSLTFTVTQTPLVLPSSNPPVLDNPPPSASVTVPVTVTYSGGVRTVTIPPVAVPLVSSGRDITLQAQGWSNADGTGAILADGTTPIAAGSLPTANASEDISLTPHVTGFALTPPNPTITLVPSGGAAGLNTVRLKVTAVLNNSSATPEIDPFYLTPSTSVPGVATESIVVEGSSHYLLVTAVSNGQTTIKVQDNQVATKQGTVIVTVVNGSGSGGLHIN